MAKAAELAIAAPQVMAMRTARMLAAGAAPGARDRAESSRMVIEKVQASWECLFAIGIQFARIQQEYVRTAALQWLRVWTTPWWLTIYRPHPRYVSPFIPGAGIVPHRLQHQRAVGRLVDASLAPVHKRATANARRLSRSRKR